MKKLKVEDVKGIDWYLSLNKIMGKKVVDVQGYLSKEFDEATFCICFLLLEDGTEVRVGGEHDFPYIDDNDDALNLDEETLDHLYKQEDDSEEGGEDSE